MMMMMGSEHCVDGNYSADTMVGTRDYGYGSAAAASSTSMAFPITTSSPGPSSSSSCSPARFIEHSVSKMDTLAGVAIKYGVEVADIKRMNGLVTDIQMFALKTLYIPLPGRHPPSPSLANDTNNNAGSSLSGKTPTRQMRSDILESFDTLKGTSNKKVTSAMNTLQGYYGLKPPPALPRRTSSEGFEMTVYSNENANSLEDGPFRKSSPAVNPPLGLRRKCRSVSNGFSSEEEESGNTDSPLTESYNNDSDSDKWFEKVRRRQKPEGDHAFQTPEKLLKEENGNGGWFSAIAWKGLALRSKAMSRNSLSSEAESGSGGGANANTSPSGPASVISEVLSIVRKSSSTPSLQEQENNSGSSLWSGSKWNLKSDLQALSSSAIAKPILNGFSKPMSGRKTKAALD